MNAPRNTLEISALIFALLLLIRGFHAFTIGGGAVRTKHDLHTSSVRNIDWRRLFNNEVPSATEAATRGGAARAWKAIADATSPASELVFPEHEEAKEGEEAALRRRLPGFMEDWQLRDALEQCELDIVIASGRSQTGGGGAITYGSSNPDGVRRSDTSVGSTCQESEEAESGPTEGLRHFSEEGVDGVFMGAAEVPIRYRLFPKYSAEKKKEDEEGELLPGVVLLTGLMETMAKYGETISYFNERGFSVYTYDHHGQGLSGRLPVPDGADLTVAHITNFKHYVDDLIHFSTVIIPSITREPTQSCVENASGDAANPDYVTSEHECFDTSSNQPPSRLEPTLTVPPGVDKDVDETSKAGCLGDASGDGRMKERVDYEEAGSKVHDESNGSRHVGLSVVGHSMGALIAMYATLESPRLFRRVVMAAPMVAPSTGRLPNGVVGALAWTLTRLGRGHRSPIRRPARASMEWSRVTHDKERLRLWEGLRGSVGCVLQRGPSFAWLAQAIGASKRARRRYPDVTVPTLVLEAGLDGMVRSDAIERFRRKAPSVDYRLFPGAYHDLFDETDDIRLKVLEETVSFLSSDTTPTK